jgi:hypothetical protein
VSCEIEEICLGNVQVAARDVWRSGIVVETQNELTGYFEIWKARIERCVASDGNGFEGDSMWIQ